MSTQEQTFKAFTPEQAARYAKGRGHAYPTALYQAILDYHSGKHELLMDIGTGPGKVVFNLMPSFKQGIGIDASPEMIKRAQIDAESNGLSSQTHFIVCAGEDCDTAVPSDEAGQVDVITVAMAAHWFDLPRFYAACARALRPGGTLAIWTCSGYYAHPSTPHHEQVQKVLNMLENDMLGPYMITGNVLSRGAYENLLLPWTVEPAVEAFALSDYARRDWDRNGVPSAPSEPDGTPGPYLMPVTITPEALAGPMNAASAVVRWREANPDKANGEEDAVNVTIRRLQDILGANTPFVVSPSYSLLLLKKR